VSALLTVVSRLALMGGQKDVFALAPALDHLVEGLTEGGGVCAHAYT
jgi:hypothetical protein